MLSAIAISALMGLTVSASPAPWGWSPPASQPPPAQWSGSWAPPTYSSTSPPNAAQTPFKFPLANGYPNVDNNTLIQIEKAAHGTLPNGALPSAISDTSATTFEVISMQEIFEVAYFTSLIYNITNYVPGYEVGSEAVRTIVLNALTAVQAQEELHYLGASGILKTAGRTPIQPCEYVFPVNNFDDAIALASTFTDLVLGTLQDVLATFGSDGDAEFLPLVGSIIGQEGEQNGFYRNLGNKIPSQLPFLTRSAGPFAFSALNQIFIVNGSCPNSNIIKVPIFPPLNVESKAIQAVDQDISFSVTSSDSVQTFSGHSIVYLNQQNVPLIEPIKNVQTSNGVITFSATFPYTAALLEGLTIAAVVGSTANLTNADQVAAATLFGPGLIDIN